jgi:hypothetical protein
MNTTVHRIIAEALANQFGMDAREVESAFGTDPVALIALSMMRQTQAHGGPGTAARRLASVATLVGACPVCLGEDAECVECDGKGTPGDRIPNTEALVRWLRRPLSRIGLRLIQAVPTKDQPHAQGEQR